MNVFATIRKIKEEREKKNPFVLLIWSVYSIPTYVVGRNFTMEPYVKTGHIPWVGPIPKTSMVRSELSKVPTPGKSIENSSVKLSPMSTAVEETVWLATSVKVTRVSFAILVPIWKKKSPNIWKRPLSVFLHYCINVMSWLTALLGLIKGASSLLAKESSSLRCESTRANILVGSEAFSMDTFGSKSENKSSLKITLLKQQLILLKKRPYQRKEHVRMRQRRRKREQPCGRNPWLQRV